MQLTVETRSPLETAADVLALGIGQVDPEDRRVPARLRAVDRALGGRIAAVLASGDFRGKAGESLWLYPDPDEPGIAASRVLLVGAGEESALDAEALRHFAARAVGAATARRVRSAALLAPAARRARVAAAAEALAEGAVLGAYRFDRYQAEGDDPRPALERVALLVERPGDARQARAGARVGVILAESQNVARDLSNEPANELPPAALAREAERVSREVGLRCRVLEVAELRRRKMGAILAVGQGSSHPPRLVVMEHNPPGRARKKKTKKKGSRGGRRLPTICLVGKGITFDSGGISIKPSAGMDEMKHDMSGAAAVVGAMRAVALLRLPLHVVGVVGAAENMPSGTAYRPGDVVRSASQKTIEVLNTDAEGRVVLADALHFARTEYEPAAMVDLATLTGACVVALGKWATGLFSNNDALSERLRRAGEATGERLWPMPLWEEHRKAVKSEVADVKNATGREAGSSTAAAFLQAFVGDTAWAHLDIAGTGWTGKPGPAQPRGATGVGVRLLVEMLRSWKGGVV